MRYYAVFTILFALVSSAAAVALNASPTVPVGVECLAELPCDWPTIERSTDDTAVLPRADVSTRSLTNAQRLARGMALKPPVRRFHAARADYHPTPSHTPNSKHRGIIRVDRADNGAHLGYISKKSLNGALLRYQSIDKALTFTFELPKGATSGKQINLSPEDGRDIPDFPFFGLVQGRDNKNSNLKSGSYHYAYMTLTNKTPAGSVPKNVGNAFSDVTGLSRTSESAVWSWSASNNKLVPQWINTDGSAPNTQLFAQSTALYAGGDASAYAAKYPSPVTLIKLTWVPQ